MNLKVYQDNTGGRERLQKLIDSEDVSVTRILVAPNPTEESRLYVFYESAADKTEVERERLKSIQNMTKGIANDPMVQDKKLKNVTQRRMYLLDVYGINSTDADMVMDWLAVQMALGQGEKDEQKRHRI